MNRFILVFILFIGFQNFQVLAALTPRATPEDLGTLYKFDMLTPTGDRIFRNCILWESIQIDHPDYPNPRMCASNVSKVMRMSDLPQYSNAGVGELLKTVVDNGGRFIKLPKDKYEIIQKLNTYVYNGNLPVGTIIGGCLYSDCFEGREGQRHSAIVADIDNNGVVYLYHNNWYRPENEGGVWKPNMVSKMFLNLGFLRQWMTTPWLKIIRDPNNGKIVDITSMLPQIDDLDPFQYYLTLAIPKEITDEISAGEYRKTYGRTSANILHFNNLNSPFQNTNYSDPFDIRLLQ